MSKPINGRFSIYDHDGLTTVLFDRDLPAYEHQIYRNSSLTAGLTDTERLNSILRMAKKGIEDMIKYPPSGTVRL